MAKVLIYTVCSMLVMSHVETCYVPGSQYVLVPETIPTGYLITKVEAVGCDSKSLRLTVSDPTFSIDSSGAVAALRPLWVTTKGRTFSVRAQDYSGQQTEMEVHLYIPAIYDTDTKGTGLLRRSKRRWGPPPLYLLENDSGPFPKDLETVVSDSVVKCQCEVFYEISGPGVDEHPVGLFSVIPDTGMLKVHRTVDREEFPKFRLRVEVFNKATRQPTDDPLNIEIEVDDMNDNAPEFVDQLQFTVLEHCDTGTVVGKVNTTDKDKADTEHVKINYQLLSNKDLFAINAQTGVITTVSKSLDREVKDTYMVLVQIKDLSGRPQGLTNTATATISLTDINDNPPTFKSSSLKATVKENESEQLILRIPVEDKDLINTPNWISKFVITKGNENGNFRIATDPKTNEGLLYVTKPLDHEKNPNVKLEIQARNEAELSGTSSQWMSIPVDVTVTDVDEGPEFTAPIMRLTIKENLPNGTVIGTYKAVDPETETSEGIKYYKVDEPAAWINLNRDTGELRVANTIDRESHFVKDGIYNITVKAVDATAKTGMGKVVLVIEDENDNEPRVAPEMFMCENKDTNLASAVIVAEDGDQTPYSAPFRFSVATGHEDVWSMNYLNGTAATLHQVKELPSGFYKVPVMVTDLQGSGREQTVKVRLCQCRDGVCMDKESSVSFGPLGILAMLLPLLLLLLLFLVLGFFCLTTRDTAEFEDLGYSGGNLLTSNIEGPGDEVDCIPVLPSDLQQTVKGSVKGSLVNVAWPGQKSFSTIGGQSMHGGGFQQGLSTTEMQDYTNTNQYNTQYFGNQFTGSGATLDYRRVTQDSAYHHNWLTNGVYLDQKLSYMGNESDGRYADDIIHSFRYEGAGSAAGSVGCCSDHEEDNNLDFINTLGPKFNRLADVCKKT
ncbi:desmocollin 2-like protein [Cololabis saira]|uniref:desmocollin 2-like protein n=1 Tax=Cololabis saira TaxID=129043 RepID=UPI002AD3FF63|nr:desmocollin 2-like protein [Cololabis saira]